MTTRPYPFLTTEDPADIANFCREIAQMREDDMADYTNLKDTLMRGRKVDKIPTGSGDVDPDNDRVGDFNYATDTGVEYMYICMNVGGSAVWRRMTLGSF